jgi:predicted nucleic acid-binding protein
MWYFDTNILVYSITAVDEAKMRYSQGLINDSLRSNKLLISPVTLQELIFVFIPHWVRFALCVADSI